MGGFCARLMQIWTAVRPRRRGNVFIIRRCCHRRLAFAVLEGSILRDGPALIHPSIHPTNQPTTVPLPRPDCTTTLHTIIMADNKTSTSNTNPAANTNSTANRRRVCLVVSINLGGLHLLTCSSPSLLLRSGLPVCRHTSATAATSVPRLPAPASRNKDLPPDLSESCGMSELQFLLYCLDRLANAGLRSFTRGSAGTSGSDAGTK